MGRDRKAGLNRRQIAQQERGVTEQTQGFPLVKRVTEQTAIAHSGAPFVSECKIVVPHNNAGTPDIGFGMQYRQCLLRENA